MRPNDRRCGGDSLAMSLVTTPAVVLQTYRYSETSKVVRLATRDLGVQSAIAKGALRPKSRFGAGLELLSEGVAQLYFREARELHTLGAFDLVNLRRDLADDVGRFAGAAALAEVMLKMAPPAPLPAAYDTLTAALDALAASTPERADATAVRSMWRLVAVLGFETSLPACVRDGAAIEPLDDAIQASVVDVPGHEGFVRNMLAGATGLDVALLVIAADEGIMPQTEEHLAIVELLGVRRGIPVITKRDLVDAEWLELVRGEVSTRLGASRVRWDESVATSVVTGEGLADLRDALRRVAGDRVERPADDVFRLA